MEVAPGLIPELESPSLTWAKSQWHLNYWYVQLDSQLRGPGTHTPDALFDEKYIFRCPSDPLGKQPWPYWHHPSYGYNLFGSGNIETAAAHVELGLRGIVLNQNTGALSPTSESDVKVPSNMIALADGMEGRAGGGIFPNVMFIARNQIYPLSRPGLPTAPPDRLAGASVRRHDGILNVLFSDGHVEAPKLEQMFLDRSDASLQRWNKDNEPHREWLP